MPPRRRILDHEGRLALSRWSADPLGADRHTRATAVRFTLEEFAECHPGRTCEVRVPPFGVVQCLAGPRHTRGTPPNVVECDDQTWLALVTGQVSWAEAQAAGRLRASGERADLTGLLPLPAALSSPT